MDDLNFDLDDYADILARDSRYNARAYTLLTDVIRCLSGEESKNVSGADILEEFKERALDLYGPMAYTVLTEWGLNCTEDIGEMIFNLVESRRIGKHETDSKEDFVGGYDFKEVFLGPYQT